MHHLKIPTLLTLAILAGLVYGCKKKDSNVTAPYAAKMSAARTWSGKTVSVQPDFSATVTPTPAITTVDSIAHQSMSVQITGGSTIQFNNVTLNYAGRDLTAHTLVFSYVLPSPAEESAQLVYFYQKDSIYYHYSWSHHWYGYYYNVHTD